MVVLLGALSLDPRWLANPLWLVGMASILLASALDLQAVSLGDLTLVKPLLGMQAAFAVAIGVVVVLPGAGGGTASPGTITITKGPRQGEQFELSAGRTRRICARCLELKRSPAIPRCGRY